MSREDVDQIYQRLMAKEEELYDSQKDPDGLFTGIPLFNPNHIRTPFPFRENEPDGKGYVPIIGE